MSMYKDLHSIMPFAEKKNSLREKGGILPRHGIYMKSWLVARRSNIWGVLLHNPKMSL